VNVVLGVGNVFNSLIYIGIMVNVIKSYFTWKSWRWWYANEGCRVE